MKTFAELSQEQKTQVVDLFSKAMGYEEQVEEEYEEEVTDGEGNPVGEKRMAVRLVANPETKNKFFNRMTGEWPVKIAMQELARQQAAKANETFFQ